MIREYELITNLQIHHMNLFLVNLVYRTPHYHKEMEFGLVLDGELLIHANGQMVSYQKNDFFIINAQEVHELFSKEGEALILSLQISRKLFSSYFPDISSYYFEANLMADYLSKKNQELLSALFTELAYCYLEKQSFYEFKCISMLNSIFYMLYTYVPYRYITAEEQNKISSRMSRLKRITEFIEDNYSQKLLLSEIANRENLTMTYLSHFFKDVFGMSFQNYLTNVRFEHAVNLIETSKKKIIDVSLESGFSDVRYLNKVFLQRYGCTAHDYQKNRIKKYTSQMKQGSSQSIINVEESLSLLLPFHKLSQEVLTTRNAWDLYN